MVNFTFEIDSFSIGIGSLISVNIVFCYLLNIFNSVSHDNFFTSFGIDIEKLSGLKFLFEFSGSSGIRELSAQFFELTFNFIREIMANPHQLLIRVWHELELARRLLSDLEITDRLQSFLLSHDEPNFLLRGVSQKLSISNTSLLPLIISEPE